MPFNPTSLKNRSSGTSTGAGYTGIKIGLKRELLIVPVPDDTDRAVISGDFVFGSGAGWMPVYSENEKIKITEEKQDGKNSSYLSKIEGFYPGDDENIRALINDENIGEEDAYVMVSHCEEHKTLMLGKGECCPATVKFSFDSGDDGNPRGWTFSAEAKQNGVMAEYRGIGAATKRFAVQPDDATPDVSRGSGTYMLPENSKATEITALDNARPGNLYVLEWGSSTNHSTIKDGAVFHLSSAFSPKTGAKLYLQAIKAGEFAERSRHIP